MFGMVVAGGMGGRKRRAMILLMFVVLGMVLLSVGCGTNGASTKNSVAPGTYQVTVTAATSGANAVSHSTTVSLTVS
jgi:ABC-type glycerol-3-phosphate transport system substrate-binding protein